MNFIDILVKNFDKVIIPKFETSRMIKNKESNDLPDIVKRNLQKLSHYRFQTRLVDTFKMYDKKVIFQDESYTSITCGKCGNHENNSKEDRIITCSKCNFRCERDLNGARNIFIRFKTRA